MSSERSDLTGGCLCGAVRYTAGAETLGNAACHCGMCRSWSGHVWASVMVPKDALKLTGAPKWFRSSGDAERGFCPTCGTSLFWRADGADHVSVGMGTLDEPTGQQLERHIYVDFKGDYYDIADGLPQEKSA